MTSTMNATSWNDELQRNLVCGPNGVFPGYEAICAYHTRVGPLWSLILGFWSLYIASVQRRLPARTRSGEGSKRPRRHPHGVHVNGSGRSLPHSKSGVTNLSWVRKGSRGSWVVAVFGIVLLVGACAIFLGQGCVYDVDDIRGQIGDALGKSARNSEMH
jgi:hypothetical protein